VKLIDRIAPAVETLSLAGLGASLAWVALSGRYGSFVPPSARLGIIASGVGLLACALAMSSRLGTGEDIGNMAAFILAPGNTWLNGQTITLDGGDALANGAYFTEYQAWDDADWARARQMAKAANQPNVNDGDQEATPT